MTFDVFMELFGSRPPESSRQAVAAVLRDLKATGPNEFGHYELRRLSSASPTRAA